MKISKVSIYLYSDFLNLFLIFYNYTGIVELLKITLLLSSSSLFVPGLEFFIYLVLLQLLINR